MKNTKGMTLIELMMSVGLSAVVLVLAIPAFTTVIDNTKVATVATRFQTELAFARSEALTRRRYVTVCRTQDNQNCIFSGPWSDGAMTFEDRNGNRVRDGAEEVLRVQTKSDFSGLHIVDTGRRQQVSFRPDGRSAGTNVTLRLCDRELEARRLLIINVGGRVRVAKPTSRTPSCRS